MATNEHTNPSHGTLAEQESGEARADTPRPRVNDLTGRLYDAIALVEGARAMQAEEEGGSYHDRLITQAIEALEHVAGDLVELGFEVGTQHCTPEEVGHG